MSGPLAGYKIIELGGIGPGPFAGMMLADMGADVLRIERTSDVDAEVAPNPTDILRRGKQSIGVDLHSTKGRDLILGLVEHADALYEGFRPGVTERLGLGPDECMTRNPRLVYGRMTGFGQEGPYSRMAGHDINYIALSGTLSLIGRKGDPPVPPNNFLGDFGGGGMFLAFGIVCALLETKESGLGQIVDVAMIDGAATLAAMVHGAVHAGTRTERGTNGTDGGRWYYEVFETADGEYISLGPLEPQFFHEMLRLTGLEATFEGEGPVPAQSDRSASPVMKERLTALVKAKTRAEWCDVLEGSNACFAPVLSVREAHQHPHHLFRKTFTEIAGVLQPSPAPRFSRTVPVTPEPPGRAGQHTDETLATWGIAPAEFDLLRSESVVR